MDMLASLGVAPPPARSPGASASTVRGEAEDTGAFAGFLAKTEPTPGSEGDTASTGLSGGDAAAMDGAVKEADAGKAQDAQGGATTPEAGLSPPAPTPLAPATLLGLAAPVAEAKATGESASAEAGDAQKGAPEAVLRPTAGVAATAAAAAFAPSGAQKAGPATPAAGAGEAGPEANPAAAELAVEGGGPAQGGSPGGTTGEEPAPLAALGKTAPAAKSGDAPISDGSAGGVEAAQAGERREGADRGGEDRGGEDRGGSNRTPGAEGPAAAKTEKGGGVSAPAAAARTEMAAPAAAAASGGSSEAASVSALSPGGAGPAEAPGAATTGAAPAPPARLAPHMQVGQHIVRRFDGSAMSLELRLDPPELGQVSIKLEVDAEGGVKAAIGAETPAALAELVRGARDLERALSQAGLDVDRRSLTFDLQDRGGGAQGREERSAQRGGGATGAGDTPSAPAPLTASLWRTTRVDLIA